MLKKNKIAGMSAALTANIIFGFSLIFSKMALEVTEPMIILPIRFITAFIALNILLLTKKVKLNLKGKKKTKLILMSTMQPLLYFIFELYGLSLVSSALSGVIIALVPVGVMLLASIFLKEKPNFIQIICSILSIIAISLISIMSNDKSQNRIIGILFLICAVICSSAFNVLSRSESKSFSPFERTYMMFLIGSVGFFIISLIKYKTLFFTLSFNALKTPQFLIAIFYLAILSSVVAFLLYNYSTSNISVVQSASFSNIITVVSIIAGVTILKEKMTLFEYIMCGIIIIGVYGVNRFAKE